MEFKGIKMAVVKLKLAPIIHINCYSKSINIWTLLLTTVYSLFTFS